MSLLVDNIADVNQRLERLYEVLETGEVELDDLIVRIRELKNRQEQYQTRRLEIESSISDRRIELSDLNQITGYVNDLREVLGSSSITERRAFIRSFVKEIKVTDDNVILSYTLPWMTGDGEEVLPMGKYGGPWLTVLELFIKKKELIPAVQQLLIDSIYK